MSNENAGTDLSEDLRVRHWMCCSTPRGRS
jgi:hypothetical protein